MSSPEIWTDVTWSLTLFSQNGLRSQELRVSSSKLWTEITRDWPVNLPDWEWDLSTFPWVLLRFGLKSGKIWPQFSRSWHEISWDVVGPLRFSIEQASFEICSHCLDWNLKIWTLHQKFGFRSHGICPCIPLNAPRPQENWMCFSKIWTVITWSLTPFLTQCLDPRRFGWVLSHGLRSLKTCSRNYRTVQRSLDV